ncbi:MAG: trypsin-like peptidase domain-containing protein, partial [Pirellula sp.]|nr:trypsin-like peptidase domain-containing protein [Pirellula sp.]
MMGLRTVCCILYFVTCLNQIGMSQSVGDCVALEFVVPGCPHCRSMDETAENAVQRGWAVRRIDVTTDPYSAQRWRIHSTPTTLLIREGREVDRILGPVDYDELLSRMMAASRRVAPKSGVVPTSASFSLQPIRQNASPNPETFPDRLTSSTLDPKERAQRATVRIRVDEPNSQAVGTGTIVDTNQGEALVITCGHLFRGLGPNPRISVELFDSGHALAFPANLIHFEAADKDVGLVSFRPGRAVATVPMLAGTKRVKEGESVFSIGCDHGSDPSRRDSRVTKLNRYLGAPNIEVAGMPVQGRSGGGLFNELGELIGICYAADQELDEGLYAGTEVIYEQLAKIGLHPPSSRGEMIAASTPQRVANGPADRSSRAITIIVKDHDGMQRELH